MLHSPEKFRELLPYGYDGLLDWEYFIPAYQGATGRKITPMDFDKVVEINGHRLVWETFRPGKELILEGARESGQSRALKSGWAKGYETLVFVCTQIVNGEKCLHKPIWAQVYWASGGHVRKDPVEAEWLFKMAFRWASWANKTPHPFQYGGSEARGKDHD